MRSITKHLRIECYHIRRFDKKHGMDIRYHENGQIYQIRNYRNNSLHGMDIRYHENGQIEQIENYRNDRLHGIEIQYRKTGQIKK